MILPRYALFAALLASAGLPIYIHAPKFYVDSYGVGLAQIGTALLLLRLVDVVQDPLLGRLAGRLSQTARVPAAGMAIAAMSLGMVGLFAITPPFAPILWMALCLAILFTGFSFLTILFYARGVGQAQDLGEGGHIRLAGWRETGALLGVSLATMAPFIIDGFGLPGFAGFALIFAGLALVAGTLMAPLWPGPLGGLPTGFSGLLADREIRRLLIISFVNAAPVAVTSTLFLFFVEDRLGAPNLAGPLLLLFFLAAAAAAPVWSRIARKFGAVPTLASGMVLSILAFGWAYMLGTGDTVAFAIICMASGAALGADMTLLPAIYATHVDKIRAPEAEAFGLWNFAAKLTLAIAAATVLPALDLAGYIPGASGDETALAQLSLLYAALPCALKLIALALLLGGKSPQEVQPCPNP
jgi:GPH family glycoside/pentoside/hexuronide:cation symporter